MKASDKPRYGSWVAPRLIVRCAILTLLFGEAAVALCLFAPDLTALIAIVTVPAVLFAGCTVYFLNAKRLFAPGGGDIQNRVLDLLVDRIDWNGEGSALDIGCGSGALAVKLARRYPQARITGLDFWGAAWAYGKAQCERNAALEGVGSQTEFMQGSAFSLPFADGAFDLVVSNMTFHEVKGVTDKRGLVREALRVLRPGGAFVFQDLFLLRSYFGTPDELLAAAKAAGAGEVHFEPTHTAPFIPKALKLPFMLGAMGVLRGKK